MVFFLRYLRLCNIYFSYFHGRYLIRNRKCLLFVSTWIFVLFVFVLCLVLNAANLSASLDCPYMIAPSGYIASVSDCPYQIAPSGYISSVSGLSILDCFF